MGLLITSTVVFTYGSFPLSTTRPNSTPVVDSVYLCFSGSAYAYHRTLHCTGLNRCTHEIGKVSSADAVKKYGRKPCGYCCR